MTTRAPAGDRLRSRARVRGLPLARRCGRAPRARARSVADVSGLDLVTVQDHPYKARAPRHLDAADGHRGAHRARCGWRPTWPTCRCAPPVGARRAGRDASTSSAAAGPSSASAPAPSGTPSRPRAAARLHARGGGRRARRGDRRHPRACGPDASGSGRCASTASTTAVARAARRARRRAPASASGSAPTSRGCCGVTGRLADGWLPSLGYADPDALAGMNARIDEAAAAAGRAPGRSGGCTTSRVVRLGRRLPARHGRRLGRAARRAHPRRRA